MAVLLSAACVAAAQPNVLFMMADQMRWDVLGPKGAGTPNLDKLAAEGVTFDRAYTSTPSCTPARAALLTGMKPWNHGMLGYGAIAGRYPIEMPREMVKAGYRTAQVGKDHFGWNKTRDAPRRHDYESIDVYDGLETWGDNYTRWFRDETGGKDPSAGWPSLDYNSWRGAPYALNESLHPTAWTGAQGVRLLERLYGDQKSGRDARPFFAKVSFHRPHSPYDPPKRLLDAVAPEDLPPMRESRDGWDDFFVGNGCGPQNPDAWCGKMPDDQATLARRAYYASVRFVDEWVGKVLAAADLSNTLVIWTADHGDGQGDLRHWRKSFPYEVSSHVPLLLRWPDSIESHVPRGSHLPNVAELRDILPTVVDAAGATVPEGVDGMSLLCPLDGSRANCRGKQWREVLDLEHSTCYNASNHWNALTDGEMKYIFNANFEKTVSPHYIFPQEQLFNLTADPYEQIDLWQHPDYNATLAKWRARMVAQFEAEGRGPAFVKNGELQVRKTPLVYGPNYPKN